MEPPNVVQQLLRPADTCVMVSLISSPFVLHVQTRAPLRVPHSDSLVPRHSRTWRRASSSSLLHAHAPIVLWKTDTSCPGLLCEREGLGTRLLRALSRTQVFSFMEKAWMQGISLTRFSWYDLHVCLQWLPGLSPCTRGPGDKATHSDGGVITKTNSLNFGSTSHVAMASIYWLRLHTVTLFILGDQFTCVQAYTCECLPGTV